MHALGYAYFDLVKDRNSHRVGAYCHAMHSIAVETAVSADDWSDFVSPQVFLRRLLSHLYEYPPLRF